jgi:hypothetical protein
MFRPAEIRKLFTGTLVVLGSVVVGLVALFVILGFALAAIAVFFLNAVLRRVLPRRRRPRPGGDSRILEGEFRIERDDRAR